jgi:putative membrane protein
MQSRKFRRKASPWNIIISRQEAGVPHFWLTHWLIDWLVSALALYVMAQLMPGIEIRGFGTALIATIVIGLADVILGPILRFLTLPLTFLTLGLFLFVIKGFLLKVAAMFTPGFRVNGCLPAILGAVVLSILSWLLQRFVWATL